MIDCHIEVGFWCAVSLAAEMIRIFMMYVNGARREEWTGEQVARVRKLEDAVKMRSGNKEFIVRFMRRMVDMPLQNWVLNLLCRTNTIPVESRNLSDARKLSNSRSSSRSIGAPEDSKHSVGLVLASRAASGSWTNSLCHTRWFLSPASTSS